MRRMSNKNKKIKINTNIGTKDIKRVRQVINEIYLDGKIEQYIIDIIFATRQPKEYGLPELEQLIAFGASPRASIYLALVAKTHAFLRNRGYVTPEDVRAIGMDVMRHRILVTYEAEAEEITSEEIIKDVLNKIEVP